MRIKGQLPGHKSSKDSWKGPRQGAKTNKAKVWPVSLCFAHCAHSAVHFLLSLFLLFAPVVTKKTSTGEAPKFR